MRPLRPADGRGQPKSGSAPTASSSSLWGQLEAGYPAGEQAFVRVAPRPPREVLPLGGPRHPLRPQPSIWRGSRLLGWPRAFVPPGASAAVPQQGGPPSRFLATVPRRRPLVSPYFRG